MRVCVYEVKKGIFTLLKKKYTFLNFMDNLYIPLILRNSDKQAGGLTELRFNNLYSYNRKEWGSAKRQPEFSASAHQGFRSNSGTQGPKKI